MKITPCAIKLWNEYQEIYEKEDTNIFEKREAFSKIKARFYDFVINVPIKHDKIDIEFDGNEPELNFYVYELGESESYNYCKTDFRKNTGYKYIEKTTLSF